MKKILGISLACAFLAGACLDATDNGEQNITKTGDLKTIATFEDSTKEVLVSFAEELEDGQALYLAVRRGTLGADTAVKDCSLVSDRPIAIFGDGVVDNGDLSDNSRLAHAERGRLYRMKIDDASLLVHPYSDDNLPSDQSWGDGVDTPEKQTILDRGVDTYIDICVTQGGETLRREQIDLYLAMDLNNPNIVRDSMAGAFDHNQPRISSPQKYGETCVAAMGEIPFFMNKRQSGVDGSGRPQYTYDTWNCHDSVHIPVTVTTTGDSGETVEGPDWDQNEGNSSKQCDKRQYIYPLCEQGPRVISAVNEAGTHWVLLCRKGIGQTPKLEQQGVDADGNPIMVDVQDPATLSTRYNDIAMLGHNPRTGRTCFFQNALGSRYDGARVAHPADIEKSADTDDRQGYLWSGVHGAQGGINCNNCHDSDPFILTPWIAGALRNDVYLKAQAKMGGDGANAWVEDFGSTSGSSVVPMMGVHPDFPLQDREVPYTLVNYEGQNWTHEKQLVGAEVDACTNCHRLGAGNTLDKWATRSVGLDTAYNKMITEAYLNDYKRSHYMPFDPRPGAEDPLPAEADWPTSDYATAIEHIKTCKSAGTCEFKDIPREGKGVDPPPDECWSDFPPDCDF